MAGPSRRTRSGCRYSTTSAPQAESDTSGDGAEPEASGPWPSLVVMLEVQSMVDYLMPLRIRNYVDRFHMERRRGRRLRSADHIAPVLPIVLYTGWRARQAGLRIEDEDMAQVNRMEHPDDVEAFYRTRAQIWEEERRAEGRVVGQRESMCRQAAMKFDAETAARLGAVLEGVTEQEVFDAVLAALLECDTPSELLARATEARRRTNGRNAPADC